MKKFKNGKEKTSERLGKEVFNFVTNGRRIEDKKSKKNVLKYRVHDANQMLRDNQNKILTKSRFRSDAELAMEGSSYDMGSCITECYEYLDSFEKLESRIKALNMASSHAPAAESQEGLGSLYLRSSPDRGRSRGKSKANTVTFD